MCRVAIVHRQLDKTEFTYILRQEGSQLKHAPETDLSIGSWVSRLVITDSLEGRSAKEKLFMIRVGSAEWWSLCHIGSRLYRDYH